MADPSKKTSFAIHQPNYIPWLGYFYKIANCDIFVYLDSVQYPRGQSFSPRNRVKTPNGAVFLSIPVSGRGTKEYREITFAEEKWRKKHLKTIELSYRRAPFFEEIFELYRGPLLAGSDLVDLNTSLIGTILAYLDIPTKMVKLSELLPDLRRKSELILDIADALGAGIYLSGTGGGKLYNDEPLFAEHHLQLKYSDFQHPVYPQLWGDFEPNLSILDALFNCGPEVRSFLNIKNHPSLKAIQD